MVPLKARHGLCRRAKRTGRQGVEREAGADKVLTMMVSAEHHCADGNQNEAVIGDKLMYGVSDPEPGILIQEQTQTHTHGWWNCRIQVREHFSEFMAARSAAQNAFHYISARAG